MTSDATHVRDTSPRDGAATTAQDVPPGYKQTEVGVIPEEWSIYTLFELAGESKSRFDDGDWVEAEFLTESGVRLLQTGNIGVGKFVDKEIRKYISDHSFDFLRCKSVQPGDLLICRLADPAGRACIVPNLGERRMITAVDVTIFRPVPELAASRFLLHVFGTRKWFADVSDRCGGSTRSRIARGQLGKMKVQVPTICEQRAIAQALLDVDGLLGALESQIAKKRALKQAAMQQLLTGKTRLAGFGGEWETKRLDEIADIKTGPFGSALHESDYVSEGTPIITVEHLGERGVVHKGLPMVSESDRIRLSAYSLKTGDIVFSRVGSIDRNALIRPIEEGWLFSGRLLRVRPDRTRVSSSYLSHHFHGEQFKARVREVAVGQTMASLNTSILRGIEVSLPAFEEQVAIATVLSDMDTEIAALEARRDKTRAIKQGMMQQLLTGRARLVKPAAA